MYFVLHLIWNILAYWSQSSIENVCCHFLLFVWWICMLVSDFKTSCMNTNSFISLCLSVWMVFFIPLSPHSLQNPVIFVFCFFHYSSCCFLPPAFISALASLYIFFSSSSNFFFLLLSHFPSSSFRPGSLSSLSFSSLTASVFSYRRSKIR